MTEEKKPRIRFSATDGLNLELMLTTEENQALWYRIGTYLVDHCECWECAGNSDYEEEVYVYEITNTPEVTES